MIPIKKGFLLRVRFGPGNGFILLICGLWLVLDQRCLWHPVMMYDPCSEDALKSVGILFSNLLLKGCQVSTLRCGAMANIVIKMQLCWNLESASFSEFQGKTHDDTYCKAVLELRTHAEILKKIVRCGESWIMRAVQGQGYRPISNRVFQWIEQSEEKGQGILGGENRIIQSPGMWRSQDDHRRGSLKTSKVEGAGWLQRCTARQHESSKCQLEIWTVCYREVYSVIRIMLWVA